MTASVQPETVGRDEFEAAYQELGMEGELKRFVREFYDQGRRDEHAKWQAARQPAPASGVVAWMHTVKQNDADAETDLALSFRPDNFPMMGEAPGFWQSIGCRPLVYGDAAPTDSAVVEVTEKMVVAGFVAYANGEASRKSDSIASTHEIIRAVIHAALNERSS